MQYEQHNLLFSQTQRSINSMVITMQSGNDEIKMFMQYNASEFFNLYM